jgi:hypothetical protein
MYVWKLLRDNKRKLEEREFSMELTGRFMALVANCHRDEKKKPEPFERYDFFQLSYDTGRVIVEERPMTFKEAKALFGSKIRRDGNK